MNQIKKLDLSEIKNITIRCSKNINEIMLIFETNKDINIPKLKGIDSVYVLINNKYILSIYNYEEMLRY